MCILLAEDEPMIREIMAEGLVEAGFNICCAENGDKARLMFPEGGDAPSLLVSDIDMPGMRDGIQLAEEFRHSWPDLPVVLMTGRPDLTTQWIFSLRPKVKVLRKPFTASTLVQVVTEMLAV